MPQVGLGTWQSKPEEVKAAVKTAVEAGYRLIDTATCYENENAIGDAIKELIQEGKVSREELFITTKSKPEEVKAAVKNAVEAGYRLIDTATCYENENAIGDAIKELIQEGKVSREELFITTKLWLTHLHPDDTETGIRESLDRLQLDYVDLYLAHFPTCFNVELYLYWPQHELHEVCKKHNISLTSYGSLGSPGRVNFSLPSGAKLVWASAPNPFEDENVKNLAKKYSKTPAQILLRYLMDRNIAVIPKSVNPSRIVENFQVELYLYWPQHELHEVCKKHNISLTSYGSLGSPGRVNFSLPSGAMEGHPEDAFVAERKQ
ncbi:oxidoreductase, aldo/keto reductase family protein [Teladorsagia circumcincta]|uniref:Oxidoreductase, aldo/keto reductase family protein n=1 Tax=Teladorsagia circumcincta TaxID=45464 RepID=A0A2G9TZ40_TELCI|nr:oxidoreductase, aldo/keto reductase family protein [Teladorsagia circumcincta]